MNMAEALNLGCLCRTLDADLLRDQLESRPALRGLADDVASHRPNLFSEAPVFISARDYALLEGTVAALHRASALPGFQATAMKHAPDIAALDFGPQGVFMGYDFHISEDGPRLIEINTNAGGAFLHAAAARAHRACCESKGEMFSLPFDLDALDENWIAMFRAEWSAQRGGAQLRSIAIVDDAPSQQYLAPEFQMARELFLAHGIQAVVADPGELQWRGGRLWHAALPAGMPVDMVYNRLTDFDLSAPAHAELHDAYTADGAVVSPHPRAHALHADKRNLIVLGNGELLSAWGLSREDRELLAATVPAASMVTAANADVLWAQRRQLFFKPAGGYGSKGAYRGDKLTRRVWSEILAGGYIAQALVAPSERVVDVGGEATRLKLDVRAYAYAGRIQLLAARTYAGQTTNFRTPGGGFSPVVVLPSNSTPQDCC